MCRISANNIDIGFVNPDGTIQVESGWKGEIRAWALYVRMYRRGNTVQVNGNPTLSAISSRTRIATIPEGFRTVGTAYAQINGSTDYLIFQAGGAVFANGRPAGTIYFSGSSIKNKKEGSICQMKYSIF